MPHKKDPSCLIPGEEKWIKLAEDAHEASPIAEEQLDTGLMFCYVAFFIVSAISLCVGSYFGMMVVWDVVRDEAIGLGLYRPFFTLDQRVNQILSHTPLIDGHNDLAILIRSLYNNQIYASNFTEAFENGGMAGHVDLPRLKNGLNGGAFWSAFVPCPKDGMDWSDENYAESVAFTLSQIDLLKRLQALYPTHFSLTPNSSTALHAFHRSQIISPLAIEGLHQIGNSYSNLRLYYNLGVRYATLTHECHNKFADACSLMLPDGSTEAAKPFHGGLSEAGYELVNEMNRLGMIVDISHVSVDTMRDVLTDASAAPVIFSHSSAYALCPHPRNVPDSILHLVKARNSLIMINFAPDFISCTSNFNAHGIPEFYPKNNTLEHVVDHIVHVGELIGYEHVGLGSDFDGIPNTPEGLDDVGAYPRLVKEMLRRGVSDEDAAKVVGGNVLRVWAEVDGVALDMQRRGVRPVEDKLPSLKFAGLVAGTA